MKNSNYHEEGGKREFTIYGFGFTIVCTIYDFGFSIISELKASGSFFGFALQRFKNQYKIEYYE
jgi:hypothetical protein